MKHALFTLALLALPGLAHSWDGAWSADPLLPDQWVGEGVMVVFMPGGVNPHTTGPMVDDAPKALVFTPDCPDFAVDYAVETQGEAKRLRLDFADAQLRGETLASICPDGDTAALDAVLGQSAQIATDSQSLRFTGTAPLIRRPASEAARTLKSDLLLEPGYAWIHDAPAHMRRGPAYTTYGADGLMGGFDGCNGWGASYLVLDGEAGPFVHQYRYMSTLVACFAEPGDVAGEPDVPVAPSEPTTRREGDWLATMRGARAFRSQAVELQPYIAQWNADADARRVQQTREWLAVGAGERWVYEASDLDRNDPALRARLQEHFAFERLDRAGVAGTDGCNSFSGGGVEVVLRDRALALTLHGPLRTTEKACPHVPDVLIQVFHPDSTVEGAEDTLFVLSPLGLIQFRRAGASDGG